MEVDSRPLAENGVSPKSRKDEPGDDVDLDKDDASLFRGVAARFNFLSQDCPDILFGIKPGCRDMANPKVGSWKKIKVMAFFRQFCLIFTFKRNHCFSRHQNKARNSKGKCNIAYY